MPLGTWKRLARNIWKQCFKKALKGSNLFLRESRNWNPFGYNEGWDAHALYWSPWVWSLNTSMPNPTSCWFILSQEAAEDLLMYLGPFSSCGRCGKPSFMAGLIHGWLVWVFEEWTSEWKISSLFFLYLCLSFLFPTPCCVYVHAHMCLSNKKKAIKIETQAPLQDWVHN